MNPKFLLLAALLLPAACGHAPSMDQHYADACAATGYTPGSQGYIDCLTSTIDGAAARQALADAAYSARMMAVGAQLSAMGQQLRPPPPPAFQPPVRLQTNCSPDPWGGFSCF